jgi:2,4-dienoyl-CoA reductase-like NADH-dependent reductase (Old Yellow Enzyme family)
MPTLLDPVRIGAWNLANRIVMSPLTRCRASEDRAPNAMMAEYYRQRSSASYSGRHTELRMLRKILRKHSMLALLKSSL